MATELPWNQGPLEGGKVARGTNSLWNLPGGTLGPPAIACVLGLGQIPAQSLWCSLGVSVQPEAHSPGAQHLQVVATTSTGWPRA